MSDTPWTWVHAKILVLASDETPVSDLLDEHYFSGFPGGHRSVKSSTRDETAKALLDLAKAGAIDVSRREPCEDVPRDSLAAIVAADSTWVTKEFEVTEGPRFAEGWRRVEGIEYREPWSGPETPPHPG